MQNEYELCYSRISGRASDLYADYVYGNVVPSDFVKLIGILNRTAWMMKQTRSRKTLKNT